ncbi:MAG: nuclear transport factor 2 family protein [Acidimicrobiia bacterium]|nr:nuclear transport factor 2 family protein [Acidimicrobiia bacterium]
MPNDRIELVEALIAAIERGDVDVVRSLYSPSVIVWANFDGRERDRDASLSLLEWLISVTSERRYEIVRRIEIEGGVLQQHILHGTTTAGATFSMPACLVINIDNGVFVRIDEYLDPAAITAAATDPATT